MQSVIAMLQDAEKITLMSWAWSFHNRLCLEAFGKATCHSPLGFSLQVSLSNPVLHLLPDWVDLFAL